MRSIPTTIKAQLHTTIAFIFLLYVAPALSSSFDVLQEAPFPSDIFTQGFEKADGKFYLSSGGYRSSFISVVDNKGHELIRKKLSKRFFSEGLTIKDGKIYVLTWKKGILLVLDKNSLELQNALHYSGEGWGLTQTTEHFLMSNGSDIIQLKDFQSFKTLAELNVTNNGSPVQKLNELEFAEGLIWANAWHDDHIYAIDPATGKVIQKWNLKKLRQSLNLKDGEAVLNGIAYDHQNKAFWITGKLWPKQYLVKFHFDTEARVSDE